MTRMGISVYMFGLVMVFVCVFVPVLKCDAQETTISECYGENIAPVCPTGSYIAITSYYDGFKAISSNCAVDGTATGDCCKYNASGDCRQEAPAESRYVDSLSGRSDGTISTSSVLPSLNGCNSSLYTAASGFSVLSYSCIPGNKIGSMCSNVSLDMTTGNTVYLQNKNYPDGILLTDTHCNCSVEVYEFTPIHLSIIHLDLYNDTTNCQQNLTLYDGQGHVLRTFMCEDHPYNTIVEEVLNSTYIRLEMNNRYNVTNHGKFWLEFQGNGTISLKCPAEEQKKFAGCVNLEHPQNGTVNVTSLSYMATATYTCNSGFTAVGGDPQRTCLSNNTWSGEPLVCQTVEMNETNCEYLKAPPNATVASQNVSVGGSVIYRCDPGYTSDPDTLTRYCLENGTWSGQEPECRPVECSTLRNPPNGLILSQNSSVGGQATYTCIAGYEAPPETLIRTCFITGEWDGEEPRCYPKVCGHLEAPANGKVVSQNASVGGSVIYSCNHGYTSDPNTLTRYCQENSTWSGQKPVCRPVECDTLPDPPNGFVQNYNRSVGSQATYVCNEGYEEPHKTLTRVCLDTGKWDGEVPECSKKGTKEFPVTTFIAIIVPIVVVIIVFAAIGYILFRRGKCDSYSLIKYLKWNHHKDNMHELGDKSNKSAN